MKEFDNTDKLIGLIISLALGLAFLLTLMELMGL